MRLDVLLVERGLAPSRERAQALILGGAVRVAGEPHAKAGQAIPVDADVELVGEQLPFVSRGGLKLAKALEAFGVSPAGKVCLDVGASTGGFTDCLLQAGATRVYAVDVGHGQLDWKLRQDPRVAVLEKTNIRNLTELPETPQLATIDVSFISLAKVLPPVTVLLCHAERRAKHLQFGEAVRDPSPHARGHDVEIIALIKPQFEAGPKAAPKGVVKDSSVHRRVILDVLTKARELGWSVRGLVASPILGPAGNREFLVWLDRTGQDAGHEALVEQCLAS